MVIGAAPLRRATKMPSMRAKVRLREGAEWGGAEVQSQREANILELGDRPERLSLRMIFRPINWKGW